MKKNVHKLYKKKSFIRCLSTLCSHTFEKNDLEIIKSFLFKKKSLIKLLSEKKKLKSLMTKKKRDGNTIIFTAGRKIVIKT